jgi:hypothetical protein
MPLFGVIDGIVGGRMVLAYNVVTLFGFVGVGLAVFALAVELIGDRGAALVAATVFSLSAARSASVGHTQLAGFLFAALALLALIRFLERRRWRSAVGLGAAAAATWLMTVYYALLLIVVVVPFLVVWLAQRRLRPGRRFWTGLALAVLVAGVLVAPTLPPYIRLQKEALFRRAAIEQVGVRWADVARVPPSLLYRAALGVGKLARYDRGALYPGLVLSGLVVMAAAGAAVDRRRHRPRSSPGPRPGWPLAVAMVPCLALVIGQGAGWLSAPFGAMRAVVPGVSSLRDLDRFWAYPLLCLALAAGAGAARVLRRCGTRWRPLVLIGLVGLAWVELLFRPPLAYVDLSAQATAADHRLRRLPPGPVLELPEPIGPNFPYVNAARELRSLIDRDPRVDGYSGNVPPLTTSVEYYASRVAVPELVPVMRRFGVRYLLLHAAPRPCEAGYGPDELSTLARVLQETPGVTALYAAGTDLVVLLAPAPIDRRVPVGGPGRPRPAACG